MSEKQNDESAGSRSITFFPVLSGICCKVSSISFPCGSNTALYLAAGGFIESMHIGDNDRHNWDHHPPHEPDQAVGTSPSPLPKERGPGRGVRLFSTVQGFYSRIHPGNSLPELPRREHPSPSRSRMRCLEGSLSLRERAGVKGNFWGCPANSRAQAQGQEARSEHRAG